MRKLLLPLLLLLAGCTNSAGPPVLVVGHVSDQARRDKAGDQAERGIRLALHELDKEDALMTALGGRKVRVHHTNARGELDAFTSEAVRLESINRAVALMGGNAAKEVTALDQVKIPVLTFHGHPVAGAGKNVFYLGMMPARQGTLLARAAAENEKMKRVVMFIDERLPEATVIAESFTTAWNSVRKEGTPTQVRFGKDAKWTELIDGLKMLPPDALLFAGQAEDFNAWHKALRSEKVLHVPILFAGPDGSERGFDVTLAEKQAILLVTALHPDPAFDKTAAFRKAYRDANQNDADVHAALAYDGFRILAEAMKNTQSQPFTTERLREKLLEIKDFSGVTGPLTVTADRQVQRPLHVVEWRPGAMTLLKRVENP